MSRASPLSGMGPGELIQHLPIAAMVVEAPSGRIVHVNARAREMVEGPLGRRMPSVLASDWQIFHPDGRPYLMDEWPLVRSLRSGEEVVDEEYFNVLPGGSRLFVRCSSAAIYDEGEIVGGLLVMHDVTAEKRAEDERAFHAILVDNVEDAVVGTDPQFRLTVWNRGAERLYGFAADEVLGRDAREVASYPGDQSRLQLERELLERDGTRTEITAHRKDGTRVEVELVSVAMRDGRGSIIGYLGIHRDVTERKRAEEALRAARQRSETILESISDTFFAVDREWRYTYVNERAVERARAAWGRHVTAQELLGKSCWDLFPEHLGTAFERELHRALREERVVEFEARSPATDTWVEVRVYPSETGLSVYSRDVSERRWAQEEIGRRAEQQALVAGLGLQALASDDLDALMREAVGLVARTLGVELAGIAELLTGGEAIRIRTGSGWSPRVVGRVTERVAPGSQWSFTLASPVPVVSADLPADRRFTASALLLEHGAVSGAGVVIQGTERPFGVLEALTATARAFSDADVNLLQAVANVLGMAVERAEYERRITEVRDDERRRIARDLHDEALQDLTDMLARATLARPGEGDAERRLAALAPGLKRIGSQLRGAIYDLRLAEEEDRPFPALLTALVELQRAMAADCEIELDVGEGTPTGPLGSIGTEVLRIVGEAVVNARRHADARHIRVAVAGSGDRLSIEVADDGHGLRTRPPQTGALGSGLQGMRERAALLEAHLDITSDAGAGTRVRLSVPLGRGGDTAAEIVRVLLVEDHTAVREAIAAQFEREPGFEIIGQAATLAEVRPLLDEEVDIAVIDLGLPDGDGSEVIKALRQVNPRAQALVLSATLDRTGTAHAIESGASGTLDKTAHLGEVVDAVRRLRAGETLLDLDEIVELRRFAGDRRVQEREHRRALESLTPREHEVLQALAEGLDTRAVASRLHITTRTQRNHVANILAKLGVHSQLQAVLFALHYGIVEPG